MLDALPASLNAVVVTRSEGVRDLATAWGYRCVLHRLPEVRDTIRLGMEALPNTEGCLFCVGDQPLLTRATLQKIMAEYQANPACIVRAAFGGREGNPALFPPSLYGELLALGEGEAGVTVIRRHQDRVRTVEASFAEELTDADTPDTLATLVTLKQSMEKE